METIQSVKNLDSFTLRKGNEIHPDTYEGFEIVTNKQRILFGVSNQSSCCESWGHISSEDDLEQFVGAELIEVTRTDTALNTVKLPEYIDEGGMIFVTFVTSKGPLQFVVYNAHNGYYGHSARLESEQLKIEQYI